MQGHLLEKKKTSDISDLPCLCAASRKVSRIMTSKYNRHLKPIGLKVTQFSMLANIARNPGISVSALAKLLIMDQTTVTRNLKVLLKSDLVCLEPEAGDQRIKKVRLSEKGADILERGRKLWNLAQREIEEILGRDDTIKLLEYFKKLSG